VAIVSLALGIGANTAFFTLIDQILLRKLPVKAPDELVMLYQKANNMGSNMGGRMNSYPLYQDLQKKAEPFADVLCRRLIDASISVAQPDRARPGGNGLRQLLLDARRRAGARPRVQLAGRRPGLSRPSGRGAQLRYWVQPLRRDPQVVGKKILVNDYPMTIVGVSAAGFAASTRALAADPRADPDEAADVPEWSGSTWTIAARGGCRCSRGSSRATPSNRRSAAAGLFTQIRAYEMTLPARRTGRSSIATSS
jgi:hypothetical protein